MSEFAHGAVLWGDPVTDSATGVMEVEIKGYAKRSSLEWPFNVANEFLGSQLANRIGGLPVPVGVVVPSESGGLAWASIAFSSDKPPKVDPAQAIKDIPHEASGVTVFDILVANQDRHSGNLRYAASRKQLYAFDHSHALLGVDPDAEAHMAAIKDDFVIHKQQPNKHCLLDALESPQDLMWWVDEIKTAVTRRFLERLCKEAHRLDLGVDKSTSEALFAFLSHRRDNLRKLVLDNSKEFSAISESDWPML